MILVIIDSCRNGDKGDVACVQTQRGLPNGFHLHTVVMFPTSGSSVVDMGLNSNEGTDWCFLCLIQKKKKKKKKKIERICLSKTGTPTIR